MRFRVWVEVTVTIGLELGLELAEILLNYIFGQTSIWANVLPRSFFDKHVLYACIYSATRDGDNRFTYDYDHRSVPP